MGIPKLTGFILHNFTEWKYVNVRNGRLVIDGSSLCYNLYFQHYQWEMGGEYCEFYSTVLEYCRNLRSLGIEAYVVMDGIDFDDSKRASHEKRCKEKFEKIAAVQSGRGAQDRTVRRCNFLPLFVKIVFQDAVRDSGVNFFVADGEADQSIVALANHLQCPVIGNDSDFFIFEIKHGYIPFTDSRNTQVDLSSPVKCFHLDDFIRHFDLRAEQCLFLPLIIGNDVHTGCSFQSLNIFSGMPIGTIITNMRRNLCTEDDIRRLCEENGLALLTKVRNYYTARSQSFSDLSSSRALCAAFPSVPRWILDFYKQGMFSPNVLHIILSDSKVWRYLVVVDDMSKSSAWKKSMHSRRYIMGVLSQLLEDGSVIYDTDRCKASSDLYMSELGLKEKHCQLVDFPLEEMPRIDIMQRQRILIKVFNCKHIQISLSKIPNDLKLAVVACRAWLKDDKERFEPLVTPLVFCILSCSGNLQMPKISMLGNKDDLDRLHSFAQWQCMLYHVIVLNQLLSNPFLYTSPAKLFSSSVVEHYYQHPPPFMKELPSLMISVITKE